MSTADGSNDNSAQPVRSRNNRSSPFLVLAACLLIFAAAVGAAFLLLRPTNLRIAVGPSGSDDMKLIQALAQRRSRGGADR